MATLLHGDAVFLHVPKTGGTLLRRLFVEMKLVRFNFARDHSDMPRTRHVSRHYPGNFLLRSARLGRNLDRYTDRCFKFCFVRNPFDWYESCWRFLIRQDMPALLAPPRSRWGFRNDPWHPLAPLAPLMDADFNRFIFKIIQHRPGFLAQLFAQYADPRHIDFVGKQETLAEDIRQVFARLNYDFDEAVLQRLGRVNESEGVRPVWQADNRERIGMLERPVFEQYGYIF